MSDGKNGRPEVISDPDTLTLLQHRGKIESVLTAVKRGEIDESYPANIYLAITNYCNQECAWCGYRALQMDQIPFQSIERLIKDINDHPEESSTLTGIVQTGWGEPTIHPNFMDVVRLIGDAEIPQGLISDGIEAD